MQVYVCIKHVPDSAASITIINGVDIEKEMAFLINPFDEHALTAAADLKKQLDNCEVTAICLGPENAHKTLRSALAMGADKGLLIETPDTHDPIFTARALKAAMDQNGEPDLILTGKESIDAEGMQTMFRIAALYDFPAANNAIKLELSLDGDQEPLVVDQEISSSVVNTFQMTLPAVIGCGKKLNTPRYPTFPDVVKARKKPIDTIALNTLHINRPESAAQIIGLEPLTQERTPEEIKGNAAEIARQIKEILRNEAGVIP